MLEVNRLVMECPFVDNSEYTMWCPKFVVSFTYEEHTQYMKFITMEQAVQAITWLSAQGVQTINLEDKRLDDHCCRNCQHNKDKGSQNSYSCHCNKHNIQMYNIEYASCSDCFTDLDEEKLIQEDRDYWDEVDFDDSYCDDDCCD